MQLVKFEYKKHEMSTLEWETDVFKYSQTF